MISSCTCPGHEVVFVCAVAGGGATIWQGTALEECANGRIILRHSQFESGHNINQSCGVSGPVGGRAISVVNDSYISQLTVNVSQHLNGSTIECASDNGTQVGSRQILLTTDSTAPLPLLDNITLADVNRSQLTFSWSSSSQDCPAVHYNINATDCGKCSDMTTSNNVTCNYNALSASTLPQTCSLRVQTVVCDDIVGTTSEPVTVLVKGWLQLICYLSMFSLCIFNSRSL